MNAWLWGAAALLIALALAGIGCFRGDMPNRLAALEFAGVIATLDMVLLVEGFGRTPFYDLPVTLAILSFGGGMVFARFAQRWL